MVYFWGYCIAHWVQTLCAVCWIKPRWDFSPSMLLGVMVWWPGFSLYFVHFDLGGIVGEP